MEIELFKGPERNRAVTCSECRIFCAFNSISNDMVGMLKKFKKNYEWRIWGKVKEVFDFEIQKWLINDFSIASFLQVQLSK